MSKRYLPGIAPINGAVSTSESLKMIANAGWRGTFTSWDHSMTEEWANTASKLGLIYQSIHAPFSGQYGCHFLWQGGEDGERVRKALISCVDDCADFDIPVMVIHPFIGFLDHTPTEIGIENYRKLAEHAAKRGVMLGFENVEGEEYLAALMSELSDIPSCGFCFDTGHEMCYNGGKDMLALYGNKLCHTHFNDNLGIYDPDLTWENDLHLLMGDGIVDFKSVMERIDKTPYEGLLCCELSFTNKPRRNDHDKYAAMGLEAFYREALERMNRIINRKL